MHAFTFVTVDSLSILARLHRKDSCVVQYGLPGTPLSNPKFMKTPPTFAKMSQFSSFSNLNLNKRAISSVLVALDSVTALNASENAFFAWVNALRLTPTSLIEWASKKTSEYKHQ